MPTDPSALAPGPARRPRSRARRGAAAVELALVLPVLCFICLASVDFARLFYAWASIADCARDGALYGTDTSFATSTTYTSSQQAALADATNLSPTPTIATATGVDSGGNSYIQVTATYQFTTLVTYPGIPSSTTLTRTLRMNVAPP